MSKDYGERWRMGGLSAINRHGCPIDISEHARAVACVNALAGIPTESLPEVKKAWLASKLIGIYSEVDEDGQHLRTTDGGNVYRTYFDRPFTPEVIKTAQEMRERGADFGELNALLDSVKD